MSDVLTLSFDGPDGAGKTSHIAELSRTLTRQGLRVFNAGGLSRFEEAFPRLAGRALAAWWFEEAPPETVSRCLLTAAVLREKYWTAAAPSYDVVLLDRGPITVIASCLALLRMRLNYSLQMAEDSVTSLNADVDYQPIDCASVLLCSASPSELAHRLGPSLYPHYGRYQSFLYDAIKATSRNWPVSLVIDATDSFDVSACVIVAHVLQLMNQT